MRIDKPNAKKKPSELYIPYNSSSSTKSSIEQDEAYSPVITEKVIQQEKVSCQEQEIEQVVAQLDLGTSTAAY